MPLTISRRTNEHVVIGGPSIVTIGRIERGKVKLTITADPETLVYRHQLVTGEDNGLPLPDDHPCQQLWKLLSMRVPDGS